MFDEETNALLTRILTQLESDEYEYGGYFTVGGPTGTYQVRSPYNTECEYAVVGCGGGGAGQALVAVNDPSVTLPDNAGAVSYGLAGRGDSGNAIPGLLMYIVPDGNCPVAPIWNSLPQPGNVYIATNMGSGHSLYVTVAFRRKLDRYIPALPRPASPHRNVQSRRQERTFAQGFEAREQAGLKHG